ncbi:MAG TPA: ATP-binding protein [Anaerolineaceae bacterium]
MATPKKFFTDFVYRHLAAFASVVVTTLILRYFKIYLEIQLVALLYLLPVMVSTVAWGLAPGILAGFFAFLAFNFYFITPFHTLAVHKTQDLITLIIFLIVSVTLSQLIGQARAGIRLARSREWEATCMYELISALAGLQNSQLIAQTLAEMVAKTFHFDQVEVLVAGENGKSAQVAASTGGDLEKNAPLTEIPLLTGRGQEGILRIWKCSPQFSEAEKRLLEAFTSQGALALERIRLANGETRLRVLEESDRLKSSLLNSVSHELRSPLAAIKASISSLRTGAVDWNLPARQELMATVEEETDHLNLLVGNLLDMSRIESGALKPQKRWNSIAEIALGVITKQRKLLTDYHLEIDFPKDLPLVPTDYIMIEQVFTNLLSNSIKYAPPGSRIGILGQIENGFLHVQVTNQGPPVPPEHLDRIFEKFYRVTEADRVTGTGLGLSICKGIIEAHDGRIWAENQPDSFVFHFLLPLTLNGQFPEVPKEAADG